LEEYGTSIYRIEVCSFRNQLLCEHITGKFIMRPKEIGRGQETRPNQWESWVVKRSFPGAKYYFKEKICICGKVGNEFLFP
jgi:hypothetical protein